MAGALQVAGGPLTGFKEVPRNNAGSGGDVAKRKEETVDRQSEAVYGAAGLMVTLE